MRKCVALIAALCLVAGCASFKAALQNMTPAQKAKYSINVAYTVSNEAINMARIFVENQEDLDKIQAKIEAISTQVNSSVNVILALIPPGMDGVAEYAQEKVDRLQTNLDALSGAAIEGIEPVPD